MHGIQRVVHSYQARPVHRPIDEDRLPETSSSQPFATADNLKSSIAYLSSSLSGVVPRLPQRKSCKFQ